VKCGRARRKKKLRRAPGRAARPRGVTGEWGAAASGRRRDVAASGGGSATWLDGENASGVGRAAGGRAGGQWCGKAARGSWQPGRSPARGAAGGAAVKQRGRGERKTMRTYLKFSKSARGSL
jgi:hypothetical protein